MEVEVEVEVEVGVENTSEPGDATRGVDLGARRMPPVDDVRVGELGSATLGISAHHSGGSRDTSHKLRAAPRAVKHRRAELRPGLPYSPKRPIRKTISPFGRRRIIAEQQRRPHPPLSPSPS